MEKATYFTPEQIAEHLQITVPTILQWLRTGKLQGIKLEKFWRVHEKDFEAFIRKARITGASMAAGEQPDLLNEAIEDARGAIDRFIAKRQADSPHLHISTYKDALRLAFREEYADLEEDKVEWEAEQKKRQSRGRRGRNASKDTEGD